MASLFGGLLPQFNRKKASPTKTIGAPGTAIYGGFIQSDELNANLSAREERYKTYSEILANTSIVAAGTRYFLNLVAKAQWSFQPSEADTGGKYAELLEQALTSDPKTPWHRIIRRAAMYRFYGFSFQEWTARRSVDGWFTFKDIAPRAQLTIEQWDMNDEGDLLGVVQRSPQTQESLYLPRGKLLYMVDDSLSDSPEGLGLFRHLVSPAQRVARYEQLEGIGFEHDLRGTPVGRGPYTELAQMQDADEISLAERVAIEAPLRDFIQNHTKASNLGLLLDSITYENKDDGKPSSVRQWDLDILRGGSTSFGENAAAIERLNRDMARILGVEQLMLDGGGSNALSQDKTSAFFLMVDGALSEIRESIASDLVDTIWRINGWPDEMKPELATEAIRFTDVEQVAKTLSDMASAGAILDERDPVVDEVRDLMGVERRPVELVEDIATRIDEGLITPPVDENEEPVETGEEQ